MQEIILNGLIVFCGLWALWALAFGVLWAFLKRSQHFEIVDAFWSLSLGLSALVICALAEGNESRRFIIGAIAMIWFLRLGGFLFIKRSLKGLRDGRYTHMLEEMGDQANKKMFNFFQIQALSVAVLSLPFMAAASNSSALNWFDKSAMILFVLAILGQSAADHTLNKFRLKKENAGQICQDGLWAYSRHPNYFFEWLHWWCYVLLAIPHGYLTAVALIGPVSLYWLLTRVTGIPLTEEQCLRSRGDNYRLYQKTTSPLIPWFRKKGLTS